MKEPADHAAQGVALFLAEAAAQLQDRWHEQLPEGADAQTERYLYALARDYPLRSGKWLRPGLLLLSALTVGDAASQATSSVQGGLARWEKLWPTALAIELFQNFALVHDDIEDASLLRRGQPTLHRLWGIPLAINAGDVLFALSLETLRANRTHFPAALVWEVEDRFLQMVRRTLEGQALELGWIRDQVFPDRAAFFQMLTLKTSGIQDARLVSWGDCWPAGQHHTARRWGVLGHIWALAFSYAMTGLIWRTGTLHSNTPVLTARSEAGILPRANAP